MNSSALMNTTEFTELTAGRRKRLRAALLGVLVAWIGLTAGPEVTRDRLNPFDASLYAANGALFYSCASEFGTFIQDPMAWLWEYYEQYPAVAVRRHPPLFGVAESLVYRITGVSAVGAKLTLLIFALAFATGCYFAMLQLFGNDLIAFGVSVVLATHPLVSGLMRDPWLDIPSLCFAMWAFYWYGCLREAPDKRWRPASLTVLFMVLTLYTYTLSAFFIAGLIAHWLLAERLGIFKDRVSLASALLFAVGLTPIALQYVLFAGDTVSSVSGGVVLQKWSVFAPVQDKASLAYWTHNAELLAKVYPIQAIGLCLWLLFRIRERVSSSEWLFVLCLVTTYLPLSWIPSKSPRFVMYIALAATPLAIIGLRELCRLLSVSRRAVAIACLCSLLLLGSAVQWLALPGHPSYLAGMDRVVSDIIAAVPRARILYSGPMDANFVFYVRSADPERRHRVFRATVQLTDPKELASFVESEGINVIVFETEVTPTFSEHRAFLAEILAYAGSSGAFHPFRTYSVKGGQPGNERTASIAVYSSVNVDSGAGG